MAAEEGYRRQLGVVSSTGLPSASAEAFGAGIGDAIGRTGDALVHYEAVERRQRADQQLADFNVRFARVRSSRDQDEIAMRSTAAPGAAGYADTRRKAWEKDREGLLDGITEDAVRRSAQEQIAEYEGRQAARDVEFETGAAIGKMVTDAQQASDLSSNRTRMNGDAYADELSLGRQTIDALNVSADVKEKLHRYHDQTVTVGYLNGLTERDPKSAQALIDAGAFNAILTPQQLDQAKNGAMIEIRRADAAAAHQQALQTQALRDEVETVNAQISAGVEIPDGRLADLQNRLTAIGDVGGATKIGVTRIEAGVRREADVWKPEQYDTEINRLEAKGKRTPDEDIRLKTLRGMRGTAVATFNNNPGEWAAKNGFAPPPIDLADASTFGARAAWARTVTRQTGRQTPLFNDAEVRQLRDEASISQQGMVDVANRIAVVGGLQARQAAKQVLPNDPMLARMVSIDGDSRAAALRGATLRKANKAIVDGQGSQEVASHFYDVLGAAAQSFDAQEVGAALDVAKSLYADAKKGHSEWATDGRVEDLNPYINIALGGKKGADGFWRGGLGQWNRVPMLLPDGWTQGAFDRVLSQVRFKPDSKTGPVWSDGKPMSAVELRRYVPVRRADGRYEFHGDNGTVARQRNGKIYAIDIEAVGRGIGVVRRAQ